MHSTSASDDLTVSRIRTLVTSGEKSAVEICQTFLNRIAAGNSQLNAMTTVLPDEALSRAETIDAHRNEWNDLPLLGVPITVKDVICTRGHLTTAASKILEGFRPPYDATVVTRLQEAGAILIGKTNCDEFAMGSSTEHSIYGPSRNPWAIERTPGGSSGGAAAAVAARFAPISIASDTGGSIRQPAAFCGVVGLKPTYGRVSRYGLLAFGSSLDQIGPLALTVADAETVLSVIAGSDPKDATSIDKPIIPLAENQRGHAKGTRVGVPRRLLDSDEESLNGDIRDSFELALKKLNDLGSKIIDVDLPHADYAVPSYYLVAPAEASSNLARYDGVRFGFRSDFSEPINDGAERVTNMYKQTRNTGFGAEAKRRIMLGTYALSAGYYDAYYLQAQRIRTLIRNDYDLAFTKHRVDVIAMPTTPSPAFKLGEHTNEPLKMYLGDVFTVSANLTGLPAISVPSGFTSTGLPIGFQLTGRPFDETTLLRLGDALEQSAPTFPKPSLHLK